MHTDTSHRDSVPSVCAPPTCDAFYASGLEMIGAAREVRALDTTIAWGELGTGEPLVLLHGLLDTHRTWRRVARILSRYFRVLMPDLAGHGMSGRPDAPYTLGYHAEVIAAWMEAIGLPQAHLCGHSYGGGVAQWMVLEQRRRVTRLALVAPGGLGRKVAPAMRLAAFPTLGPALSNLALRYAIPAALTIAPGRFGHMEAEERRRFLRMNRIPDSHRAFQRSLEGVIGPFGQSVQTTDRAAEVADMPPVALFWGSEDPILPVEQGRRIAAASSGITMTTYPGCGHYPHLEHPHSFAHDLTDFLCEPERRGAVLRM